MNNHQTQEKLNRLLSFLAQDEDNLNLLIEISELYQQLNDLDSAQKYLSHANSINPIACLAHQGILHLNRGHIEEAKQNFLEALRYENTPALRYNLGFIYFISEEYEKSEDILTPLLSEKNCSEAHLLIARLLHKKYAMDESIELVNNILADDKNNADALGFLSLLYFDNNQDELASSTAAKALELHPKNYDAQVISILTRLISQNTTIEEIRDLIQVNPKDSRLWFALGNTYLFQGNLEESISSLYHTLSLNPTFYDCFILLGWCHLLKDDSKAAQDSYESAAKIAPDLADAWGGMALVYALNEDFIQAEQCIDKAQELNPECFLTEFAETIYYNHKNPLKAKQHLTNALNKSNLTVSQKLINMLENV